MSNHSVSGKGKSAGVYTSLMSTDSSTEPPQVINSVVSHVFSEPVQVTALSNTVDEVVIATSPTMNTSAQNTLSHVQQGMKLFINQSAGANGDHLDGEARFSQSHNSMDHGENSQFDHSSITSEVEVSSQQSHHHSLTSVSPDSDQISSSLTNQRPQPMNIYVSSTPEAMTVSGQAATAFSVEHFGNHGDAQTQIASGSQQQSQEMSSTQMPPPEGALCLVCGDKGSGYHYSTYSCEGCKGFFKRTVQKNLVYHCKENGKCVINKFTRNSCQFCRFNKCMENGMKREAVREDRSPGGKHRHKRQRLDGAVSVDEPLLGAPEEEAILVDYEDKLTTDLINAHPEVIPPSDEVDKETMTVNDLMQYGYVELKLIIEWARKVPGFSQLCIEDQMALLKSSFMELNVLRLSYRSLTTPNKVRFADKIIMTIEETLRLGWGKDLLQATLDFVDRISDIILDLTEFCLINAVVLSYPDASGITNKGAVTKLQCQILEALRKYTSYAYPNDPRRYGKILLRLPTLRLVSAKAAERFLSMTLDGTIRMNALVKEMFN